MKTFIIIFNLILIIFLSYLIQNNEEGKAKITNELIYFPSGQYVKQLCLEYSAIVSDILWLQAIQYYGYHRLTDVQFTHLYKIFDVITMLNPYFTQAYVFGATLVIYDQKEPELGMRLIDKGLVNMPNSWRIPFMKGFLNYVYMRDYNAAYIWFRYASTKPDAPNYCKKFAAASLQKKGDYITSLKMWSAIYEESVNQYEIESAKNNIIKIISEFLNTRTKQMERQQRVRFVNNEIKKYSFLPFNININIKGDSIIIEEI